MAEESKITVEPPELESSDDKDSLTPPVKAAAREPRPTVIRVKCTDKVSGGGMWYQDGGVRIPKDGDGIKVEGPVKKGSWLEAQIQAGLVIIVKD